MQRREGGKKGLRKEGRKERWEEGKEERKTGEGRLKRTKTKRGRTKLRK